MKPWAEYPDMTMYVGDVREVLAELPEKSVHCVVCSPPYWSLRDYGVAGQLGLESTLQEYIETMVEVFHLVYRVLRDDGVCWANWGDSYATDAMAGDKLFGNPVFNHNRPSRAATQTPSKRVPPGLKPKDLIGVPWRCALALQKDGWYLRSDIIWSKPNPMPESVTDRPTKAHEYVFLMTKQERYYYDQEAIREPNLPQSVQRAMYSGRTHPRGWHTHAVPISGGDQAELAPLNPAGRNRRSVWTIATEAYPEAHFATFPTALVEPCILAGTSEHGVCADCGAPWRRQVEKTGGTIGQSWHSHADDLRVGAGQDGSVRSRKMTDGSYRVRSIGWERTCSCATEERVPATVLDPFSGAGTMQLVARRLGRRSIYVDLSEEYARLAQKRLAGQTWAML